jgi:hypothetical protein
MSRIHVFADEAGNFDFTRNTGASAYFILATVTFFDDRQACHDLQSLRFDLAWAGTMHPGPFHATTDEQAVRNRVFAALAPHGFRIDATILEKSKARPEIRASHERFYQYAWYYHMKYLTPLIATPNDDLLVVAASIGERRKRDAYHAGVRDVMRQVGVGTVRATHWPAAADTGLQIADYCCWAIQRKWERRDARSHALIAGKVGSEFDVFRRGQVHYY